MKPLAEARRVGSEGARPGWASVCARLAAPVLAAATIVGVASAESTPGTRNEPRPARSAQMLPADPGVVPDVRPEDRCASARGTLYLTIDTGNMRFAEEIARTLSQHRIRATFFLANEKTFRGDHALDSSWTSYWEARSKEGHAFGSHTWSHGKFVRDVDGGVVYVPQFGDGAGRRVTLDRAGVCAELRRVDDAFREATGRPLDRLWRSPGGRLSANAMGFANACGYRHVHWSPAGFLGDELPSDRYPNKALVAKTLGSVRDGDVLVMHMGIWSRKDPYAPMLDSLLTGLEKRGFCFATLRG